MQLAFFDLDALLLRVARWITGTSIPFHSQLVGNPDFWKRKGVHAKLSAPKTWGIDRSGAIGVPATHELVQPRFDMQQGIEWGPQTD
jgi:hypothetical protein